MAFYEVWAGRFSSLCLNVKGIKNANYLIGTGRIANHFKKTATDRTFNHHPVNSLTRIVREAMPDCYQFLSIM